MPFESYRRTKVAGLIGRQLAELIQQELQDPRLGLVTISDVNVSKDLSFADVYFTVFSDEKLQKITTKIVFCYVVESKRG